MQIVIPMSGFGKRFLKAGYTIPKPLIVVDGKPIIQHIVEMFRGEKNFIFICNKDHLSSNKYKMEETLKKIAPFGKIISIDPKNQKGPVHVVLKVIEQIDPDEPTIVNYADFTCYWNYADFKKMVKQTNCEGAIPCYRGFHPHTIWSNYYAYVRETNLNAIDIQEKKPFTSNPREEYASSGTYYFKNGDLINKYFKQCVKEKLLVNDEYYVSMVYRPMINDGLNIKIYQLQHFMQWGTPTDLKEYNYWSKTFNLILKKQHCPYHKGTVMLPVAGLGSRFKKEGFQVSKPLIKVSGNSMALQSLIDLPEADNKKIILRKDLPGLNSLIKKFKFGEPKSECIVLDYTTDGQATTCYEGSKGLNKNKPITIGACDNGMRYNSNKFSEFMKSKEIDIIVWGARGYPNAIRSPEMYGWIDVENSTGIIKSVSVKKPLINPEHDPIIVGTFTFKKLTYFLDSVESMKKRKAKVNGEYYIDTVINDAIANGLRCKLFEIDTYICWGTPNDLKTFEYWQACFHKWKNHAYRMEKDHNIKYPKNVRNIFL